MMPAMVACAAHGVETNLSCGTCGSPVCADCAVRSKLGIACPDHATTGASAAPAGRRGAGPEPTARRRGGSDRTAQRLIAGGLGLLVVLGAALVVRSGDDDERGGFEAGGWRPLPSPGLAARSGHSAVWTGASMLVWGGAGLSGPFADGAAFDAAGSRWTPLAASPLVARRDHTAVWTGSAMIVFGGSGRAEGCADRCPLADGAAYDPGADRWTPIAASPLAGRSGHTAVWVQDRMVVWGGATAEGTSADGAAYDPVADAWSPLPPAPLAARSRHGSVATAHRMLVWGGSAQADGSGRLFADGATFSPNDGSWAPMAAFPATSTSPARHSFSTVWTGDRMVVWGGFGSAEACPGCPLDDGAAYDLRADAWSAIASAPLTARGGHAAVWTGREMVAWGGAGATEQSDGASYDPLTDSWARLETSPLRPRQGHSMAWVGDRLVIWGGRGPTGGDAENTADRDDGGTLHLTRAPQ